MSNRGLVLVAFTAFGIAFGVLSCDADRQRTILEVKTDTVVRVDTLTKIDTVRVPVDTDDHHMR